MIEEIDFTEFLGDLNLRALKLKKKKPLKIKPFEPDSNFKTFWEMAGMFLIFYEAVTIPYRVAFNIPYEGFTLDFEYFIDIFFLLDLGTFFIIQILNIVINFYTGFYKKGILVMKRNLIV